MPPPYHPRWLLRRADQTAVAGLALVSLAAIGAWILVQGGLSWRTIDAERIEPQSVRFQVDINRAEVPELIQLPGIGEVLAARIVESRQKDGPFADIADLRRVRGIGPKSMERLRPYLLPIEAKGNVAETKQ
ncbi:MAG: helix-hairpin-helix domain-containing protein [Pirellulales bacterium]|nr:helix-hairpin-helix domain-containing protein [Pirellulales bacterium]